MSQQDAKLKPKPEAWMYTLHIWHIFWSHSQVWPSFERRESSCRRFDNLKTSLHLFGITCRYHVKNARPLLISHFVGGPATERSIIDLAFRRVTGHAHWPIGEKLLGRQRSEMRGRIEPPSANGGNQSIKIRLEEDWLTWWYRAVGLHRCDRPDALLRCDRRPWFASADRNVGCL